MLQAELDRYPLQINITMRMVNFWFSLVTGKTSKLSYIIYLKQLSDINNDIYEYKWMKQVIELLQSVGRNDLLTTNLEQVNVQAAKNSILSALKDQ